MSTKQQLKVLNTTNFPNNNTGYITPALLREFNVDMIDSTVNQADYSNDSASFNDRIDNLFIDSSSLVTTSSFNNYTASNDLALSELSSSYVAFTQSYYIDSASFSGRIDSAVAGTGYVLTSSFNAYTQSVANTIATLATTASVNTLSSSIFQTDSTQSNLINGKLDSASFNTFSSSNYAVNVSQSQQITAAFATASAYSASLQTSITNLSSSNYQTDVTQSNNLTTLSSSVFTQFSASAASVTNLSSSVAQTDFTQSTKINSLTALTASTAYTNVNNSFNGTQSFQNVVVSGTASIAFLNVIYQSSSVIYSSGSNILGDNANDDTQTLIGRTIVTGSFEVTGSTKVGVLTASAAQLSGLQYPTADGTAGQFVVTNGVGALTFDDVHTILEDVRYGENITIGDPLYVSGSNGTRPIVYKADAAIASKMPVIYIAKSTGVTNTNTTAITLGLITGVTTTGYPEGTTIYVGEGGGWSSSRPSGSNSIVQPLGIVTKEGAGGSGRGLVLNPGPVSLPNIQTGYVWVGNGSNQPVSVATSSFSTLINTGSFATTGSNSFNGDQIITGSVIISSSAAIDLIVTGAVQVVGNIVSSGSTGTSTVAAGTAFAIASPSQLSVATYGRNVMRQNSGSNGVGMAANPTQGAWVSGVTDPSILIWSGSSTIGSFYAPIRFQGGEQYTDGRVSFKTPLSASAGFTASLQDGYAWVGNSLGQNTQVPTSSFGGGSTPAGTVSSSAQIAAFGYAITGSNTFNGNQTINGNVKVVDQFGQITIARDAAGSGSQYGTVNIYVDPITYAADGVFSGLQIQNAKDPNNLSTIIEMAANAYTPEYSTETVGYIGGGGLNVNSSNTAIIMRTGSANMEVFKPTIFNLGTSTTGSAVFTELTGSLGAFSASVSSRANANASSASINSSSIANNTANIATLTSKTGSYATTGSNTFVGTENITGSLIITGSVSTLPVALSVTSNTASIDFSKGSVFTLTIPSSAITYITASNLLPGQTANVIMTQQATTGSVRFEPTLFKFPSGSISSTGSAVASAVDMVSVVSVNTTTLYSVGANRLQ